MNRRLKSVGFYKNNAVHNRIDEKKTTVINGIRIPVYEEIGKLIKFKYSDGKGFSKEQFQLFQNWLVSSGNVVIETNENISFQKGEAIFINGEKNLISKIIEKRVVSNNLRNKKTKSIRTVLFIG
jgi:hypothetical protein